MQTLRAQRCTVQINRSIVFYRYSDAEKAVETRVVYHLYLKNHLYLSAQTFS